MCATSCFWLKLCGGAVAPRGTSAPSRYSTMQERHCVGSAGVLCCSVQCRKGIAWGQQVFCAAVNSAERHCVGSAGVLCCSVKCRKALCGVSRCSVLPCTVQQRHCMGSADAVCHTTQATKQGSMVCSQCVVFLLLQCAWLSDMMVRSGAARCGKPEAHTQMHKHRQAYAHTSTHARTHTCTRAHTPPFHCTAPFAAPPL